MRRCKLLRRLRKTLNRRISRLEQRLKSISVSGANQDREVVVAYVAIEALNAWAMFSRSFYLSCVLGAKTERKKQVTFTKPLGDPLGAAITCCNRWAVPNASGVWHRRDEPAWHDPNVLMRVCGNLGCSIQVQIGGSVLYQSERVQRSSRIPQLFCPSKRTDFASRKKHRASLHAAFIFIA